MLQVKDNPQLGAFTVLVFHTVVLLALIHSCRGQSQVIGPSQPIVATVGQDVILPSYLDPVMNAFDMTVEWGRPYLDPRFVLVWRDGVELQSKKHPSYEGRTSLFTDELLLGNISLKLSAVKISDEGRYRCFIPALSPVAASTVLLVVGAASSPVVQVNQNSSGVVLQCRSEGWYPEPEVCWLDAEGNLLSAGLTETVRGPGDLYTVSSRLMVEKKHGNNFTCRVQQKIINQTRETQIHVPVHFFMVPGTAGTAGSPHVIIGSVIVCAALVSIPAVVLVVWKWRQKKSRNKERSHGDGAEQTEEEKMVTSQTSKGDQTGFQVVMEGEAESAPLMAGREEENNVDNRGEEEIESHSEHEDLQFVAERETHQDQLVTKPEPTRVMDRAEGEEELKSIKNENIPLTSTEGETHQDQLVTKPEPTRVMDRAEGEEELKSIKNENIPLTSTETHQDQDMRGRQVKHNQDKGEGQSTTKPIKDDSGLPPALVSEGQKEQPQNLHTDPEVPKEEEPKNDVDKVEAKIKKKRAKKENEQERARKGGSGLTRQKKQQREGTQLEEKGQKVENDRKLQSEMQRRKEKDEIELKPQKGSGDQHLSEDKNQEGSKTEHEDAKGKDQEGNHGDVTRMTERKAENKVEKVENELQSEREEKIKTDKEKTELKPEKGDGNQHVLDASKQEAEHEDAKGKNQEGNQSDVSRKTERKAENQKEQMNEKLGETEEKRDERENKPPSVSREVTERPDLQTHQETAERRNQELQEEKQQEEVSERRVECQEVLQEEAMETDHQQQTVRKRKHQEEDSVQTERTSKEPKKEQNVYQIKFKEAGNTDSNSLDQVHKCQEDQQDEPMEVPVTADREFKRGRRRGKPFTTFTSCSY